MVRYNLYNVYDITSGEKQLVIEGKQSGEVARLLGVRSGDISRYANLGYLVLGKYQIEIAVDVRTDSQHYKAGIWQEWDAITEYLKNKILWCKQGTEGARQITLKPKKTNGREQE